MTSWLSGGLSQFSSLTDQISTFTKDVLSETTEEIEDPMAELQVARKKIEQLEEVNGHYRTEWEKLQKHSEEVRERAETAECQVAAISQEYKKLIQERDAELRRLMKETASLKEQQRSGGGGKPADSPLKELAGGRAFFAGSGGGRGDEGEWEVAELEPVVMGGGGEEVGKGGGGGWGEYHDFGDVISSQGEINRLQMELTKLRAESRHWRALAEEKGHSTDTLTSGPMETELSSLRDQIEELQLCLQRERSQHQHQLSAQEAAHHENIRSLSLQPVKETRDGDGEEGGGEGVSVRLREAMGEGDGDGVRTGSGDETIRGSLLSALEEVGLEEVDGGESKEEREKKGENDGKLVVSSLQSELEESQEKCVQLEAELEKMNTELKQVCEGSKEEAERERVEVESLRAEVTSLNSKLAALEHEQAATVGGKEREVESLEREVERLEVKNGELRAGGEAVEAELGEAQSTSEGLRERVRALLGERSEVEQRAKDLAHTVATQKEVAQQLQSEVEQLKQQFLQERETYTRHAEQEKAQLASAVDELQTSISQHEQCISSLRTQCQSSQREAESLSLQVGLLEGEVEGKNHQLQQLEGERSNQSSDGDLVVREKLLESDAVISDLRESLGKLKAEKEECLRRVNAENEESIRRINAEKEEGIRRVISEKEEIVGQLNTSLATAKLEKEQLEREVEKMAAEDRVLSEQVENLKSRLRRESEALSRAKSEVRAVREELNSSEERRRQMESLQLEQASRMEALQTAVRETEVRLSEMAASRAAVEARLGEKETHAEHRERNLREVGRLLASREEEVAALQRERSERTATSDGERAHESSAALEAVARERDHLLVTVETKETEIQSLESRLRESREELENLNARNSELEQAVGVGERETGGGRSERDRLAGEVREMEGVVEEMRGELAAKQTECGKLVRQLEHLKAHLVQVEEQYTQDAIRAEERERGERKRAKELQETLRNSTYTDQQENLQARARVAALEEQLHVLAGQRDAAILELSSAREETEGSAAALHNLQTVLEQFQRDQSSELSEALKRSQQELASALSQLTALTAAHTTAQGQLSEARAAEGLLHQQLQERERKSEDLQREQAGLQTRLRSTEEALERLMREQGGRVDQNLVKNLVVGYVQAPDRKKQEVLNLIGKILDFSPSEVQQVQARSRSGGWLGGLWGRQNTQSPTSTSPRLPVQGASLSQLFVSFLETESLPSSSLSLPHRPPAPPLNPPPPGRIPEPDPDRPSRATTGLALGHSSLPSSQRPSISTQSLTTQTGPNRPYTDTQSLPETGTTQGQPVTQPAPLPSLHLSPVTQLSSTSHSVSTIDPALALTTSVPQLLAAQQPPEKTPRATPTSSGSLRQPTASPHHQSSILKNLLSPPT